MSRAASWIAAFIGAAILLSSFVAIERDPLPTNDEVYDATAILDLTQGGRGVPTALPQNAAWPSFTAMYGPVYFRLSEPLVRAFGFRPLAIRLPCAIGAVLAAAATAWLAGVLGASFEWMLFAFFAMASCPDLNMLAANARVDSLSIAFQIGGLAAIAGAIRATTDTGAAAAGAAAGAAWGISLLTSARVLPFFGMLGLTGVALVWMPRQARHSVLVAGVVALGVSGLMYSAWTASIGSNPLSHMTVIRESIAADWFNHVMPGQHRTWALTLRPAVSAACIFLVTAVLLAARPARSAEATFAAMTVWAGAATAIYWLVDANNVFFVSGRSFTLQMLAAALAATPVVRAGAARTMLRMTWLGVAALFLMVSAGKIVEIGVNWDARSPDAIRSFVAAHVPGGSLVLGPDHDYVYAVEEADARYRATNLLPFRTAAGWGVSDPARAFSGAPGQRRFLLWADADPLPEELRCARPFRVASFTPDAPAGAVRTILARYISPRGYPASTLYSVPDTCASDPQAYPFGSDSAK